MTELQAATHPTSLSGLKDLLALQDYLAGQRPRRGDSESVRRRYNDRIDFLEHRPMREFLRTGQRWLEMNQGRMPAKWLGVEGPFHSGKSAMAAALAINVCRDRWDALGDEVEDSEGTHVVYPVLYVVGGSGTTEKQLCEALISCLDMPEPSRKDSDSLTQMLSLIARQMRRSRTVLAVVDDVQHMQAGRGRLMTKFLKQVFSTLPCTLLFVADELDETWLLKPSQSDRETQTAADQLSKRKIITTYAPVIADGPGLEEWVELVRLCLDALVLRRENDLTGSDYSWLLNVCEGDRINLFETVLLAGRDAVGASERVDRDGLEIAARVHGLFG
jgi:hypothetical protein